MTAWQSGSVTYETGYVREIAHEEERGLMICGRRMLTIAVAPLVPALPRGSAPVTVRSLSPQLHM